MNGGSPRKQQPAADRPVDLKEVVKVLNGVYGGSQNIEKDESSFPLQQKILLCSLMLILNKGKNKDVTVSKVSIKNDSAWKFSFHNPKTLLEIFFSLRTPRFFLLFIFLLHSLEFR